MGQIHRLSPTLISRIAAGECIERPASVVKELVENALDAGAQQVDIQIRDGGRELIEVIDDGSGMDVEDLQLSVEQHATSKIADDEDLFNIHTMGFRGEALASIGAVSRLQIQSRRPDSDVAYQIAVEGGQITPPKPCAGPPGTTVSVRDLFYAVPARRKFLRTNQTEMGHITEQLARIALASSGVGFLLRHQDRVVHRLPPSTDRRQRIGDFYGPELADVLMSIHRAGTGVTIDGLVAPPAESRGSSKWEYVFVNGRYVRDRFVSHAVKEAYRSLIDPNRYPVVFLFITIDPDHVDVNVHPTKTEVRWRDSNYIHGQVLAALRDKFLSTNLDHALRPGRESDEGDQPADESDQYRERVRQAMVDFFTNPPKQTSQPPSREYVGRGGVAARPEPGLQHSPQPTGESHRVAVEAPPVATPPDAQSAPPDEDTSTSSVPPRPRAIQVHNSFLIVETAEGIMIVDQHALHERILYEALRKRIAENRLESQRLLLPHVVRVPADRLAALDAHADTLADLGIELLPAGPSSVTLQAFPSLLLERVDHERFVRDLLDLLSESDSRVSTETLVHDILDMMACKAAVKAGDPLTDDEIQALLQRRQQAERSSHCPHGRPTTLHMTLKDLERQFHRR